LTTTCGLSANGLRIRSVTSLGHQGGEEFSIDAQIYLTAVCPRVSNCVQHIFSGEAKNFIGSSPP